MNLPAEFGAGVAFGKGNRWRVGFNYEGQLWSNFSSTSSSDTLINSNLFAIGLQWRPFLELKDYKNYLKRVIYRFGAYYGNDPRTISSTQQHQLSKYGITFGFGLPVKTKRSQAFVNIGFEYGYLGHPDVIQEHFFKVNLGFTFNERNWFIRTKFR